MNLGELEKRIEGILRDVRHIEVVKECSEGMVFVSIYRTSWDGWCARVCFNDDRDMLVMQVLCVKIRNSIDATIPPYFGKGKTIDEALSVIDSEIQAAKNILAERFAK